MEPSPIQDCTVYVSNIPFSLTNNDVHQIFGQFGTVTKVTIVKDRQTRKSKGVAFIVYQNPEQASKCIQETNQKEMLGRVLKSSIAKDNGRAEEFSEQKRHRGHDNKVIRCFECGEEGHLSYACPTNALGSRELPPSRKGRKSQTNRGQQHQQGEGDQQAEDDSLGAAIQYEQRLRSMDAQQSTYSAAAAAPGSVKKRKFRPSAYFSDEEDETSD